MRDLTKLSTDELQKLVKKLSFDAENHLNRHEREISKRDLHLAEAELRQRTSPVLKAKGALRRKIEKVLGN